SSLVNELASSSLESITAQSSPNSSGKATPSKRHRRERRAGNPFVAELNYASMDHMSRLTKQCLQEFEIENAAEWEKTIINLMVSIVHNLKTAPKEGDDIDIRSYIKIKKMPGGVPSMSRIVYGAVF